MALILSGDTDFATQDELDVVASERPTKGIATAWVHFNGDTAAINAQHNVASVGS